MPYPVPVPYDRGFYDPYRGWNAAAGAVAVAGTALAIGALVAALPADCRPVDINGTTFEECGNTWYRPRYNGHAVAYEVVSPPR